MVKKNLHYNINHNKLQAESCKYIYSMWFESIKAVLKSGNTRFTYEGGKKNKIKGSVNSNNKVYSGLGVMSLLVILLITGGIITYHDYQCLIACQTSTLGTEFLKNREKMWTLLFEKNVKSVMNEYPGFYFIGTLLEDNNEGALSGWVFNNYQDGKSPTGESFHYIATRYEICFYFQRDSGIAENFTITKSDDFLLLKNFINNEELKFILAE